MPLNPVTLQSKLTQLFDDPPQTTPETAAFWADAMLLFAVGVVPTSPAVPAAARALQGALLGMDAPGAAIGVFQGAFAAFAGTVAAGMAPPGVPPPAPFILPITLTDQPQIAASAITVAITVWMKTGTSAPPGSIPWA